VDGSKALIKASRRTFGRHTQFQRCQVHYADLRIMPTSAAKPAWEAVIAVKEADNPDGLMIWRRLLFPFRKGVLFMSINLAGIRIC
jgi:hypothetical protein